MPIIIIMTRSEHVENMFRYPDYVIGLIRNGFRQRPLKRRGGYYDITNNNHFFFSFF